jgi:hypothetical protein
MASRSSSRSSASRTAAKKTSRTRRTTTTSAKPTAQRPSSGISRIDQPSRRTHGYFVRLDYRKTPAGYRPRLTAFFGDASHGGRKASWQAAETWLAKMRRSLKKKSAA